MAKPKKSTEDILSEISRLIDIVFQNCNKLKQEGKLTDYELGKRDIAITIKEVIK